MKPATGPAVFILAVVLLACGGGDAAGRPRRPIDPAGALNGGDDRLQPGLWEITDRIVHTDEHILMPRTLAHYFDPVTHRICLTAEQAAHPFDAVMSRYRDPGCTTRNAVMAHGHMSATSVCPALFATMSGIYGANWYRATDSVVVHQGPQPYNLVTQSAGRRVAACPSASH